MAINPLQDFDFSVLNLPEFKEDSVREDVLIPILKALGYKASGVERLIRSKSLVHPFVKIGSQKRKVNIVPDYILEVDGKYRCVIDAKAPTESN